MVSLLAQSGYLAQAKSKPKDERKDELGTYSIIHAIPSGFGADIVDIYANGALVIDNATPGSIRNFTVVKGRVNVKIYANGVVPSETATPLLASNEISIGKQSDFSFVAHLTSDEKPKLSVFKNMVTSAGKKRSWLTLRHIAAAPVVQFRVNGDRTFIPVENGMERKKSYLTKIYSVSATVPESTTVLVGPTPVTLARETNTVVYLWGAKSKGNLSFIKQETPAVND